VVAAGLQQLAPPLAIFVLFLLARSLFGFLGAASNPAGQAYVAEHTTPERRTQAMSNLAGAFGLGTVIGPFLAPLFVLPLVGLSGPLFGFAAIAVVMLAVVWRWLPESRRTPTSQAAADAKPGPRPPLWRDKGVRPFLIYGFVVAVSQTAQAQTLGFLIIDKLGFSPTKAQGFIAIAMMFGAVAALLAQWGLIRMFEMTPRQLLRWGAAVAAAGNVIVALAPDYWTAVAGYALSSLGFGLARPGFTAGASLAVGMGDQARVAGAIAVVNGINVVFAPAFVWLYQHAPAAPFALNAGLLAGTLAYAFANRRLRNAFAAPASQQDAAMATLERLDEGAP
jgi:predicted MFS family arabinose efflux permease